MLATNQLILTSIVVSLITVTWEIGAATVLNTSEKSQLEILENLPAKLEHQNKSFLQIDLKSCTCLDVVEDCEIVISKSTILEIDCPPEKFFCCRDSNTFLSEEFNNTKENQENLDPKPEPTIVSSPSIANNDQMVKIHLLEDFFETEEVEEYSQEETLPPKQEPGETRSLLPSPSKFNLSSTLKKKCECKSRTTCPEKYIDYGFGFHCTYDKVHCCGTESDMLPEMPLLPEQLNQRATESMPTPNMAGNESTKTIEESLDYDDELEDENVIKCYCLPKEKCKVNDENLDNLVWRRQDTLCIGETVQCCGSQVDDSIVAEKLDDEPSSYKEDNRNDNIDNKTSAARGQGGFLQPVQLLELKVPVADDNLDSLPVQQIYHTTTTLSPPQLPTYYNYQPPKYYSGYYYPNYQAPQVNGPLSTTQKYSDGYVRYPWSREPSLYSESMPGGHRGVNKPFQIEDHPRSSPNTSLLDKIANILG